VVESFHIPRALSDEALRLLTSLPMDEIERRLRVPDLPNRAADLLERQALAEPGPETPTDEELLEMMTDIVYALCNDGTVCSRIDIPGKQWSRMDDVPQPPEACQ